MKTTAVMIITFSLSLYSFVNLAEEQSKAVTKSPLIINSQVKGSQEQPKVIYIMPWQGINEPISIKQHQRQTRLPSFKPIHPKTFRKQVTQFHLKNKTLTQ